MAYANWAPPGYCESCHHARPKREGPWDGARGVEEKDKCAHPCRDDVRYGERRCLDLNPKVPVEVTLVGTSGARNAITHMRCDCQLWERSRWPSWWVLLLRRIVFLAFFAVLFYLIFYVGTRPTLAERMATPAQVERED